MPSQLVSNSRSCWGSDGTGETVGLLSYAGRGLEAALDAGDAVLDRGGLDQIDGCRDIAPPPLARSVVPDNRGLPRARLQQSMVGDDHDDKERALTARTGRVGRLGVEGVGRRGGG
eukprot:7791669-Pyramimonas_sp.AAC.1